MKIDKKNLILSTLAGLALIVIGYLVWKHEESVSASRAEAQSEQDAANQAAYAAQLQQELTSVPLTSGAGYANLNGGEVMPSSSSAVAPVADDTELNAILQAFFPQSSSSASTGTTQSGSGSTSTSQSGSSTGTTQGSSSGTTVTPPHNFPTPVGGPILTPISGGYKFKQPTPLAQQGATLIQ